MTYLEKCIATAVFIATTTACQPTVKAPQPVPEAADKKPKMIQKDQSVKKGSVSDILIERFAEMRLNGEVFVVDTRPSIFYKMGHIEGAISLPMKKVEESYAVQRGAFDAAVKSGKTLVLYCANEQCGASKKVAKWLAERGYDVSVFEGGWEMWKQSGLE